LRERSVSEPKRGANPASTQLVEVMRGGLAAVGAHQSDAHSEVGEFPQQGSRSPRAAASPRIETHPAREAHRQSLLAGTAQADREDQALVDAVSEWLAE